MLLSLAPRDRRGSRPRYSRIARSSGATGWATIPVARRQRRRSPASPSLPRGNDMKLIGVDVGGTFTDLVLSDTERDLTVIHKVPTTPADPSAGVLAGIRELCERHGIAPADVGHVFHGTTIATNAVLENRGARTGMVTSKGYRDIIHGLGAVREFTYLEDGGASVEGEGHKFEPWGFAGG